MRNIPLECKIDSNGLLYIDDKDIFKNYIPNYGNTVIRKAYFFHLLSTNDYIIKYHKEMLSRRQIIRMLYTFYQKDNVALSDIEFPIGYYKENNTIKGLIVPNYANSPSIREVCLKNNLTKYYNYHEDDKDNMIYMLSNILKIVKLLYDNGIIYTDINPGNFVICNNEIKIIDFDPKYLFYEDNDNYYLSKLLLNYEDLVRFVFNRLGYSENEIYDDENNCFEKIKKYASRMEKK